MCTLYVPAEWDTDGNGMISRREMKRALAAQCIPIDSAAINALFKQLDVDDDGGISFHELNKLLRRDYQLTKSVSHSRVIGTNSGPPGVQARAQTAIGGERQWAASSDKLSSRRHSFQQRMQSFKGTEVRELMREKDEQAIAIRQSRTEPILPTRP